MLKPSILCIALLFGYGALAYLIYSICSFIKGGCGRYAPYLSSSGKIKKELITEVANNLAKAKKQMTIADLGCGNGTLLLPLAKQFPNHHFIGYEWDYIPYTWAKWRCRKQQNITLLRQNFMEHNFKDTDILMCYALKTTMDPLGQKLNNELKKSALVFSEMFQLKHIPLLKTIRSSLWGVPCSIYIHKKK